MPPLTPFLPLRRTLLYPTLPLTPLTHFHTTPHSQSRIPTLQVRISKKSHRKNLKKIADLKSRLGDDYAIIGRDRRFSPPTEKRSSTSESQELQSPEGRDVPLKAFLSLGEEGKVLGDVVVGSLSGTLKLGVQAQKQSEGGSNDTDTTTTTTSSIRMPTFRTTTTQTTAKTLDLPPLASVIPATKDNIITGPYYTHNLTPTEASLLFIDAPKASTGQGVTTSGTPIEYDTETVQKATQQAEMLRRILSLQNASKKQIQKFDSGRIVQVFGRSESDTGSPQVQAALFTLRIQSMQEHLEKNKGDVGTKRQLEKWVSKRKKVLKYLRRRDLPRFVEVCRVIGVEGDSIRV